MKAEARFSRFAKSIFLPLVAIILFQNCAEAPPPDISQSQQASTAPAPTQGHVAPPNAAQPQPTTPTTPVPPAPTPAPPTASTPPPPPPPISTPAPTPISYPYTCVVNQNPASDFFPVGLCGYSCTGPSTYAAYASNAAYCNANPIGVPGTEIGWDANFTVNLSRPFSNCVITKNFAPDAYGIAMIAESRCR